MRLYHTLILLLFLLAPLAQAYELIMIQAVSDSKRTFITRNGKRQGVIRGATATFTAENVSVLAKAINVTGQYTQWELMNPELRIPFEKGAVVTYYSATEYLWALSPENVRQKYIKSLMPDPRRSVVFKGAITRGLSESVSDAVASPASRGGVMGEVYYEHDIKYGLAWDIGLRYEHEVVNYDSGSFTTSRAMVVGDLLYYFNTLRDY